MKEASGELNMTLVTIVAVAAIGLIFIAFRGDLTNTIKNRWFSETNSIQHT